jgi:hypothetical protein
MKQHTGLGQTDLTYPAIKTCHPERSAAKSKDLRFACAATTLRGDETTHRIGKQI